MSDTANFRAQVREALRRKPRWPSTVAGWIGLMVGGATVAGAAWTAFVFAVSFADEAHVGDMVERLEHIEQVQHRTDDWNRCRSDLIGAGLARVAVDSLCQSLYPPIGHEEGR